MSKSYNPWSSASPRTLLWLDRPGGKLSRAKCDFCRLLGLAVNETNVAEGTVRIRSSCRSPNSGHTVPRFQHLPRWMTLLVLEVAAQGQRSSSHNVNYGNVEVVGSNSLRLLSTTVGCAAPSARGRIGERTAKNHPQLRPVYGY
jgi:hypothetical protein